MVFTFLVFRELARAAGFSTVGRTTFLGSGMMSISESVSKSSSQDASADVRLQVDELYDLTEVMSV